MDKKSSVGKSGPICESTAEGLLIVTPDKPPEPQPAPVNFENTTINPTQPKGPLGMTAECKVLEDEGKRKFELDDTENTSVIVACRSIRIGSYKVTDADTSSLNVTMTPSEIMFTLPHSSSKFERGLVCIPTNGILRIQAFFSTKLPVIFVKTDQQVATAIRTTLGMYGNPDNQYSDYYCPVQGSKCQKLITFLAKWLSNSDEKLITNMYSNKLCKIDLETANSLLMEVTCDAYKSSINYQSMPTCFAPRQSTPASQQIQTDNGAQPKSPPLASMSTKSIRKTEVSGFGTHIREEPKSWSLDDLQTESLLSPSNIKCLASSNLLNEKIIDFWLSVIYKTFISEEDRQVSFVFPSSFYRRLTSKKKRTGQDAGLTVSERRHARVRSKTEGVDIFNKDFLIVPINQRNHWFCAIICFPGMKCQGTREKSQEVCNRIQMTPGKGIQTGVSTPLYAAPKCVSVSQRKPTNYEKMIIRPCILLFDSLAKEPRGSVYATLRDYLKVEYKISKGRNGEFNKTTMPGFMPKVPQQTNLYDSGLFLLTYVEHLFSNPIPTFDATVLDLRDWFDTTLVGNKRREIYVFIKDKVKESFPHRVTCVPELNFDLQLSNSPRGIKETSPKLDIRVGQQQRGLEVISVEVNVNEASEDSQRCLTEENAEISHVCHSKREVEETLASSKIDFNLKQASRNELERTSTTGKDVLENENLLTLSGCISKCVNDCVKEKKMATANSVLKYIDNMTAIQSSIEYVVQELNPEVSSPNIFRRDVVVEFEHWRSLYPPPLPIARKENQYFKTSDLLKPHLIFKKYQKQLTTDGFLAGTCGITTCIFNDFITKLGTRCPVQELSVYVPVKTLVRVKSTAVDIDRNTVLQSSGAAFPPSIASGICKNIIEKKIPQTSFYMEPLHTNWLEFGVTHNQIEICTKIKPRTVACTAGSLIPLQRSALRLPKMLTLKCGYVAWMVVRPCKKGPTELLKYIWGLESCGDPWVTNTIFVDFIGADVEGNLSIDYQIILQKPGEVLFLESDVLCEGVCLHDTVYEEIPLITSKWIDIPIKSLVTSCKLEHCDKHKEADLEDLQKVRSLWHDTFS